MRHGMPTAPRILAAAAVAACAAGPLAAQEPPEARVGDQVRVAAGTMPRLVRGQLVMVGGDSLYVRPGREPRVAVPLAEVDWIEVRHRRSWVGGVLLGVAVGAPAGAASGYLLGTLRERGLNGCGDDCGFLPALGAAGGLLGGTVLGAIVGGISPGGRWKPAARPAGSGVALSVETRL